MDRRRFVAGVAGALPWFAGCSQFRPRSGAGTEGPRYELEAYPIGVDGLRASSVAQSGDLPEQAFDVFLAALDGEKARTYGRSFFGHVHLVEYRGLFYRVTVEATGRETHERPVLRAEAVESEAAEQNAVHWSAYSGNDDVAVRDAASRRDFSVLRHCDPEASDLLPEPEHEHVEYDGAVLRLSVERRRVTETEYTYATEQVADSASELRGFLREEVVEVWLDSSDLSARQRTVFKEARSGQYAETGDLTDSYRGLLERVFGSPLPAETTGERVGYDGRVHKVHVHVSDR